MADRIPTECLNDGLVFKFLVPAGELMDIEQFVGKYVVVTIDEGMEFIGDLVRVSTWKKKDHGEIVGIYQQITLEIECIAAKEGEIRFPDKKDPFVESFSIRYAVEGEGETHDD